MFETSRLEDALALTADGFRSLKGINDTPSELDNDGSIHFDEWDWEVGVGLYGFYKQACKTGDERMKRNLANWYDMQIARGLPSRQINSTAPMLCLALLARETNNQRWKQIVTDWAEWLINDMPKTVDDGFQHLVKERENDGQLWDDTLFMAGLFMGVAGDWLNRPDWVEEAYYQFLVHGRYLSDPVSGLWYHGWTFLGNHNYAEAFWARGNAWITIAVPELFELVGERYGPAARQIKALYCRQVEALLPLQLEDGMWPTLLDQPDSPPETSATAGFAYGLLRGVRTGILPESYLQPTLKAAAAVLQRIDAAGIVQEVSDGTAMGHDFEFYRNIPNTPTPYGQALASLLLIELLAAEELLQDVA
ncbi:Unsaturated rhamnogalacturonyl hydrolase YesR [Pseudovibrio sp. Ad46]|uniref:beta-galactosidase BglB n=1 Tax=unclassified Pseudovibrio TaxID=2627060 RepID=UPI0007AE6A00|nr:MULTISPECIES: glycoside hydrolase family 88 protein [unclassified Pseudovibrio]KZK85587.1 Unsaturated rhamnogalacturonyl hydrolase YesR [Pseudovibrio sp. Ad46]KZK97756.1 Unsaturated rhamnogalacturonyl hydrolase YesR [Pseudovibrio sp. Ad5]